MSSRKTEIRDDESAKDSSGDRGAGSVGERPDLAGSRDSGNRTPGSHRKSGHHTIEDEISGDTANDPGLGGV